MNIYIGVNIKRLRLKKQITQEELAAAMGVSCAAVSKWEREDTMPDISLLPVLASYFKVSIDELMGYDIIQIENEIHQFLEEHSKLFKDRKIAEYEQLSREAYRKYPNDYRVLNCYMWDLIGDYADNDPALLVANKDELLSICEKILDNCDDPFIRLDAINMQGKILHADKKTDEAIHLYKKHFPNWYLTSGQKTEQLFAKNTPEFAHYLKFNMLELGAFAMNKKCKDIWFCQDLSVQKKAEAALHFCEVLASLQESSVFYEINYYLWCFANDMAQKIKATQEETAVVRQLEQIAKKAKSDFIKHSRKDSDVYEYCQMFLQ